MPIKIQDLVPGDELQIWMRLGLAIRPTVKGDGTPYYMVPPRPGHAKSQDLTRFMGWVVVNQPDTGVITVHVSPFNSWRQPIPDGIPKQVDLSYTALQRVRKYSKISFEPRTQLIGTVGSKAIRRPGSVAGFGGSDLRAYRTVEDVLLR
jgi:hypothetical protein